MAFNPKDSLKDVLLYGGGTTNKKNGAVSNIGAGGNNMMNVSSGINKNTVSVYDGIVTPSQNNKPVVTQPTISEPVTQPVTQPAAPKPSGASAVQQPVDNTYYSGSATETTPQKDYHAELMAAIEAQTKARRDAQLAALEAQLKQGLSDYDAQISALDPIYQNYRNQSEVERYKGQRSLRESLANRGALDSGLGRQEMLELQANYGNNLNAINMQYQSELDALNRARQALNDEAAAQRIQIESDIENVGLEARIAALKDQIAAQQESARQAAALEVARAQAASKASSANYGSGSPSITSSSGLQNVDKLIQKHQSMGKITNAQGVANMISTGYSGGILNEDDVRQLAAKYGINVK